MIKTLAKIVGKGYLFMCGLVILTVFTVYVILLGLIGFVHLILPG